MKNGVVKSREDRIGADAGNKMVNNIETRVWSAVLAQLEHLMESSYSPQTGLLETKISGINYHTAVSSGVVHHTRENLSWLPALLKRGREEAQETAWNSIDKVLALQDKDPASPTYGIWPYLFEEPLDQMKNPDWNWAGFLGSSLITLLEEFQDELPPQLAGEIKEALFCACESILRRNMGVDYTNISLLSSFVLVLTGELLDEERFYLKGRMDLECQLDFVEQNGGYAEYNSPTYGVVDIEETGRLLRYSQREEIQQLARSLHDKCWKVFAEHYHPSTGQLAPPHARSYEDVQSGLIRTLITVGTKGNCELEKEENWQIGLQWPFITLDCPEELWHYFRPQTNPRLLEETFYKGYDPIDDAQVRVLIEKGTPSLSAYTYLHPQYCLGSFRQHDMWNQRRPLLAYLQTDAGTVCFRARCMHDDMDFAGAVMTTVQREGAAAGGISFVTDHGDYHYILTPLQDSRITADLLSVDLVLTGAIDGAEILEKTKFNWCFCLGTARIELKILEAAFGSSPVTIERIDTQSCKGVRIVLHKGQQDIIDFNALEQAYVLYWMEVVTEGGNTLSSASVQREGDGKKVTLIQGKNCWGEVVVPEKPGRYMPALTGMTKIFKNGGFYYSNQKSDDTEK